MTSNSHQLQLTLAAIALALALLAGCSTIGPSQKSELGSIGGGSHAAAEPRRFDPDGSQAKQARQLGATRSGLYPNGPNRQQGRYPVRQVGVVEELPTIAPPAEPELKPNPDSSRLSQLPTAKLKQAAQQAVKNGTYPIDLANALSLAGASHLQVRIARQSVLEAQSKLVAAEANWLPSIRFGVGWNRHNGRIQATQGDVVEAGRNSLFVGGGAGIGWAPLAGGSGGPLRMMINLSLADVLFERAVQARMVDAAGANALTVTQDALVQVALGYFELVEAYGMRANAQQAHLWTGQMLTMVRKFAKAGAGSLAEVDRAAAAESAARQSLADAERSVMQKSVALARLLRLDVTVKLAPVEDKVMPVDMIDAKKPIGELIALGISNRPEVSRQSALTAAMEERLGQAQWRPWLPIIIAGASGGSFGGGPSSAFNDQASRSDVDLAAYWDVANIGIANRAERQQRSSQWRKSQLKEQWLRDQIAAEVATALANVRSYEQQIGIARANVSSAKQSYDRNYQRVLEAEGLPLELLQAIRARTTGLNRYTRAVGQYNRAQFQLLRSVGQLQGR